MGNGYSTSLRWQWANLRALAIRRKIGSSLLAKDKESVAHFATLCHRLYRAAIFCLAPAQDAYNLQTVAINYAYLLHWLHKQGQINGVEPAL